MTGFVVRSAAALTLALLSLFAPMVRAQTGSSSSSRSRAGAQEKAAPETGSLRDGVYRSRFFDFSYKLTFGWVERTRQMREDRSDSTQSLLLLSAFERPPEALGTGVNSAVIIAAENVSSYPGLKAAEQYFDPLTQVATSKGFKVANQPYDYQLGEKHLVRGDFTKQADQLTMHQSSLVLLDRGYVVSFTFIGGSEDEVEELIRNIRFGTATQPAPRHHLGG